MRRLFFYPALLILLAWFLLLAGSAAYAAVPIAHWRFDESSGTVAADASGNGYAGTLVNFGASPWVTGRDGNGLSFDGPSDYVDIGSPAGLGNLQNFTFSAWVYARTMGANGYGVLFNKGGRGASGSKRLLTNNNCNGAPGSLELSINRATATAWACAAANSITLNVWLFLVATFDPTDGPRLYINAVEVSYSVRNIGSGALEDESSQNLTLGSWPDGSGGSNIIMDDARVHDTKFTPQEVLDLYNSYFGPPDTEAPTVPTGLAAMAISSSRIDLFWTASTDNVGVAGYKIYRDGVEVGTSPTTSYSDTGLAASTLYAYAVAAYDAANNLSAQSASAQATTLPPPPPGSYWPAPEASGGWRRLVPVDTTPTPEEKAAVLNTAGINWDALKAARDYAESVSPGTVLVIRNGWIAGEWGLTGAYQVASVTKSLTGLVMARLFDMSDAGQLATTIGPESLAYSYLGPSFCLCDHRRYQMKIKHLMTMSSGLQPIDPDNLTQSGRLTRPMDADPESSWVYSSLDPNLLSMILQPLAGQSLGAFFNSQIASLIGVSPLTWATIDGGYTKGAADASASARDLARIAWLTLQNGVWDNGGGPVQIISSARISTITQWAPFLANTSFRASPGSPFPLPSDANSYYGWLFWTNRTQTALGAAVPADAYYMHGFHDNLIVVIPSKNLIVVRLTTGGPSSDQAFRQQFLSLVMASLVN